MTTIQIPLTFFGYPSIYDVPSSSVLRSVLIHPCVQWCADTGKPLNLDLIADEIISTFDLGDGECFDLDCTEYHVEAIFQTKKMR